jgi:hypothetical protein
MRERRVSVYVERHPDGSFRVSALSFEGDTSDGLMGYGDRQHYASTTPHSSVPAAHVDAMAVLARMLRSLDTWCAADDERDRAIAAERDRVFAANEATQEPLPLDDEKESA